MKRQESHQDPFEFEERRAQLQGKVITVVMFGFVGLVALSMIPDESEVLWMLIYAAAGIGSLFLAVKAARPSPPALREEDQ